MRLIVGLGNPGPEYQWTPHNLGFLAVDEIANRASIRVERPEGKALIGLGKVAGEEVILAKPLTYMNLTGPSRSPAHSARRNLPGCVWVAVRIIRSAI